MLMAMYFSPRIGLRPLAGLCRRASISLGAGVDVRTVFAREAERAQGQAMRRNLAAIADAIQDGDSLGRALAATGDYFPALMRELVEVGEQTGHLSEVLAQLAEHYEDQVDLRRTFLASIAWPMTELGLTLAIVGGFIWIMGFLSSMRGARVDLLG